MGRQEQTMISDHDIVEQMIPPAMLAILGVLLRKYVLTDVEDFLEIDRANALLKSAFLRPVSMLSNKKAKRLAHDAEGITFNVLSPLFGKYPIGIQYQVIANFIASLARDDVINADDHSPFSDAWDIISEVWDVMAEIMGRAISKYPEIENVASIEANNMRSNLSQLGYFVILPCSAHHAVPV